MATESGFMEKLLQLARCSLPLFILITIFSRISLPPFYAKVGIPLYLQLIAVDMSYRLGWIDNSVVERANKIIKQAKLPTRPPANMTAEMFKSAMAVRMKLKIEMHGSTLAITISLCSNCQISLIRSFSQWQLDKKVADGVLRLVLLKGPLGNCVFTGDYDRKALDETLHAFCKS